MYAFEIYEARPTVLPVEELAERLRAGDEQALARAITLVEQRAPERTPLLKTLFPFTGRARIIGITGAPGVGKSTFVGQAIREYRRQEKTLGVIAVDPTSPYSGGATLGDRIRMQQISDPGVFIRSMASRGQLGGLAPATADVVTLLDVGGCDRVLVETVGVGQDQVDILSVADVVILLLAPGMSDDIQFAKAGIVEAADIFVLNKSDRDGADYLERSLRESLLLHHRADGWSPPIVKTIATSGEGVQDAISAVDGYFEFLRNHDLERRKAIEKWEARLVRMLREHLVERLFDADYAPLFRSYAAAVADHRTDPYTVVDRLIGGAASDAPEVTSWRAS
jgi:LAO/AO transport system kinase